ncbi:hypothetical protein DFP97_12264 [Paenibacillus prosopidis]|uniref:Uncharacterized protein n=2 Tax=Paenibacillus prosopidis TaxID=630520 RepID=A0A368VJX3_9BACL|nr:hypothetical protein DFP97_12264 [Paenibacillus prosopidis]
MLLKSGFILAAYSHLSSAMFNKTPVKGRHDGESLPKAVIEKPVHTAVHMYNCMYRFGLNITLHRSSDHIPAAGHALPTLLGNTKRYTYNKECSTSKNHLIYPIPVSLHAAPM